MNTSNGIPPVVLSSAIGFGGGLVVGACVAFWLLCIGYVFADARRRSMPAVLWVLVVIFVPNLLGFLLYFAIRRPLGSPCSNCGQLIAAEQRFCSWCGSQNFAPPPERFSVAWFRSGSGHRCLSSRGMIGASRLPSRQGLGDAGGSQSIAALDGEGSPCGPARDTCFLQAAARLRC